MRINDGLEELEYSVLEDRFYEEKPDFIGYFIRLIEFLYKHRVLVGLLYVIFVIYMIWDVVK